MKINIKNKVIECEDIEYNVKKFLLNKSKNNPVSFLPFQVQKINITPKQSKSLAYYRNLYKTAYSQKKHRPNYMIPLRRNTNQLIDNINQNNIKIQTYKSKKRKPSIHIDQSLLQSFYAKEIMKSNRIRTADDKNKRYAFQKFIYPKNFQQMDQKQVSKQIVDKQNAIKQNEQLKKMNRGSIRSAYSLRFGNRIKQIQIDSRQKLQLSLNISTNHFEFNYKKEDTKLQ